MRTCSGWLADSWGHPVWLGVVNKKDTTPWFDILGELAKIKTDDVKVWTGNGGGPPYYQNINGVSRQKILASVFKQLWEGTLPEYTLWQTAHIQLTPGRLSIADLLESSVRVGVRVERELERVGEELEDSYSGWRSVNGDWMESELRRNISDSRRRLQELAWSCFGSHTGSIRPVGSG